MADPRPAADRARVEKLRAEGLSIRAVAKVTGIPLGTVADWSRQSAEAHKTAARIVSDDVDHALGSLAEVQALAVEVLVDVATNGVKDSDRRQAARDILFAFPLMQNQQVVSGRIAQVVADAQRSAMQDPFQSIEQGDGDGTEGGDRGQLGSGPEGS